MAEKDYIWVSTPHDPLSISGSDPYASNGNARLAVWYNCDEGNYLTGSQHANGAEGDTRSALLVGLKDLSGNSTTPFSPENSPTGTHRHLSIGQNMEPILSGNTNFTQYAFGGNEHIRHNGIRQQFIMGSQRYESNDREWYMTPQKIRSNSWSSLTWISGSEGNQNGSSNDLSLIHI